MTSILTLGNVFLEHTPNALSPAHSYCLLFAILHALLQYTALLNKIMMPQPASFSVGFQHAQPDKNTGYNTWPAFVLPGSKAAEQNARCKKGSVPVLQTVPNRCWEASGSIQSQYSAPHGLMTPEMPDSFLMHVNSGNHYRLGQEDMYFSNGFYPNYHARYVTQFILSDLLSDFDSQ